MAGGPTSWLLCSHARAAGTPAVSPDLLQALLSQLRLLLDAPAAGTSAAATAGASSLRATAALALGVACLPLAQQGPAADANGERRLVLQALPDVAGVATSAASLLEDKDPKVAKKAAAALGYLCWAHSGASSAAASTAASGAAGGTAADATGGGGEGVLQPAVAALLALRASKNEELLFAVGEALCFSFGGEAARWPG